MTELLLLALCIVTGWMSWVFAKAGDAVAQGSSGKLLFYTVCSVIMASVSYIMFVFALAVITGGLV